MKKFLPGIALVFCSHLLFAQDSKMIETAAFTRIDVSSEIDAELILEKEPGFEINFTETNNDMLVYEIVDETLKIRMKTGKYQEGDLKVKIYFTDLAGITSGGRANIWSYEEIWFTDIAMNLSNGGSIRLKTVAEKITAELIQGSILSLKGNCKTLNLKVSTAATFDGYELQVQEADVLANSGGKAKIAVSEKLKGKAISGGFIGYVGEPVLDTKISLKGEIVKTYLDD